MGGCPDSGASPEAVSSLQSTKQGEEGQRQQWTFKSSLSCSYEPQEYPVKHTKFKKLIFVVGRK